MSLYANEMMGILQPVFSLLDIGSQEPDERGALYIPYVKKSNSPFKAEPFHFSLDNEQFFPQSVDPRGPREFKSTQTQTNRQ